MVTPVTRNILPLSASNRPGTKLPGAGQLFIVVHETDNPKPGADAVMHINYLHGAEARQRQVSYHFSVDDHAIVQGLPLDEIGWHAGDGCDNPTVDIGCFRSVGIEGCINADGNETQMRRNYAELIARICASDPAFDWGTNISRGRFGIDRIKQHIQVSDAGAGQHHCPDHMLREGFWPTFMRWVATAAEQLGGNGHDLTRFEPPRVFTAQPGALERRSPTRDAVVVKSLQGGDAVTCKGVVLGQIIAGEDRWLQTIDQPMLYLHTSGVVEAI
jgi:N-acetylmuramoyl-L-alanine amidase